jgi:aryl-alcohol dehydrogenase-like predicted oxidoreductase
VEQRQIGRLKVSVVGLGCNQLGTAYCNEAASAVIVSESIDAGITFFDTADEYGSNYADPMDATGWGRSEEVLGRALGSRRGQVVIGTKFGVHPHGMADGGGASAVWARKAVEASLRRLGTDYIDLYQLHFPDPTVPIEETLGVFDAMIQEGKVREIGCGNFTGQMLDAAASVAARERLRPFASVQAPLNLLQRATLEEVMPTCDRLGLALIPYYPLASGMLTGKYRRGEPLPRGTRLSEQLDGQARDRIFSDRAFHRIEALETFARDRHHTLLELAIAWLLGLPAVATVIAGAARPGQAATNASAGSWRLTPDDMTDVIRAVQEAVPSPGGTPAA